MSNIDKELDKLIEQYEQLDKNHTLWNNGQDVTLVYKGKNNDYYPVRTLSKRKALKALKSMVEKMTKEKVK